MNFIYSALSDAPDGIWQLDDVVSDRSGHSRSVTLPSGTGQSIPLISGASSSTILDNSHVASFESTVFEKGYERQSFSLEAIVYPVNQGDYVQVLGHTGALDGICINGSNIYFSTKYANAGEARAAVDIIVPRRTHILGVHTASKNSLYIDGVLAAEADITPEQQADNYVATDGLLYSGESSTAQSIAVNGIATYSKALTADEAAAHYEAAMPGGNRATSAQHGGVVVPMSNKVSDIYLSHEFNWSLGYAMNVLISGDSLLPQIIGDTVQGGTWMDSLNLSIGDTAVYTNSVSLAWEGTGVTVEASIDDSTWVTAKNGEPLSIIPSNFNTDGKHLSVRVTFADNGSESAYIKNLVATGTQTTTSSFGGIDVTLSAQTVQMNDYDDMQFRFDWGTRLNNGQLSLSPVNPVQAVEIWSRGTYTTNIDSATQHGFPEAEGVWQIRTYAIPSGYSDAITISGTAQIGQIVLYETEPNYDELYQEYFDSNVVTLPAVSGIRITESSLAVDIYGADWAIEAAG